MSNLKNNIQSIIEKCLVLGDNMQSLRVVNKKIYPGYSEIKFLGDRENDYVSMSGIVDQLEEMISEDDGSESELNIDLTKIKEAVKVVADKIEKRKEYIKDLTEKNERKIQEQINQLKLEIDNYADSEKLALFRINMNNMTPEMKECVSNRFEELGFYFGRESFDFSIFVGEVENERKVQNVRNHIVRKIEAVIPEISKFKSGTSAVRIKDIKDFIYWLR